MSLHNCLNMAGFGASSRDIADEYTRDDARFLIALFLVVVVAPALLMTVLVVGFVWWLA